MTEVKRCPRCYVCPLLPTGLCRHCDALVLCERCKGSGSAGVGPVSNLFACPDCEGSGRCKLYIVPLATNRVGVGKKKGESWLVVGYYPTREEAEAAHPGAEFKANLLEEFERSFKLLKK